MLIRHDFEEKIDGKKIAFNAITVSATCKVIATVLGIYTDYEKNCQS